MIELEPAAFRIAAPLFASLAPHHLSVVAVLAGDAEGRVLVDNAPAPGVALLHGPEGSYLAGRAGAGTLEVVRDAIEDWAYLHIAPDWGGRLDDVLPNPFMLNHPRASFLIDTAPFTELAVLPAGFAYEADGSFGCRVLHQGEEVSRCLPDMVSGERSEIGVWTHPDFRRRGLAFAAARAALAGARRAGISSVGWHCHGSNRGSIRLAEQLGGVWGPGLTARSASLPAENGADLERDEWFRIARHFERASGSIGWMAFHAAGAWAQAGEHENALLAVELLVEGGWQGDPDWLAGNWALAAIAGDPRFQRCLTRLREAARE